MDVVESCRLCLKQQRDMLPIFGESEASLRIRQSILDCCPIQLIREEKLPAHVCTECRSKLSAACSFREQCRLSDRRLRLSHPKLFKIWRSASHPETRGGSKPGGASYTDLIRKEADRGEGADGFDDELGEKHPYARDTVQQALDLDPLDDLYHGAGGGVDGVESKGHNSPLPLAPAPAATITRSAPDCQGVEKIKYACDICSKELASKSGLRYHLKSHGGTKPHTCRFCDKCFAIPSYKERHERTHAGLKPFACHVCSAAFASANGLKYHLRLHTGEANYQCNTCGKSFRRDKFLREHIFTHTGERPFICQVCGSSYANSGSLFAHERKCRGRQRQPPAATAAAAAQQTWKADSLSPRGSRRR